MIKDMPEDYKLVILVSLETGLRLSDVLNLTYSKALGWEPLTERKTGKALTLSLPQYLRDCITARMPLPTGSGTISPQDELVFPGTIKGKPYARSTIYRAVRRAFEDEALHITPHTARKIYAVEFYRKTGDLAAVQAALRHDHLSTTLLYALSDKLQHFND